LFDFILIAQLCALTAYLDNHVYFYGPQASELAMLENALPLILLLLPIVLGTAATLLLFINLEEDPFKSLEATEFAAITLVVAAVAFGLVYFLTLSLPASGAVSAYVLAMITGGPFLRGAYNISSLKADGRGAALMFRWIIDFLALTSVHTFIPPDLGPGVRNAISLMLGLSLCVIMGRDLFYMWVCVPSTKFWGIINFPVIVFAVYHATVGMVSPAIYASFTLQGWRTASLWVAAACCVTAFGGSATVHNNGGGRSDSVCTHASFKSFASRTGNFL